MGEEGIKKVSEIRITTQVSSHGGRLTTLYYMASLKGQDESNPALRLATRTGKIALSIPAVSHMKNLSEGHMINPLLTKLVRSRWLDIGFVLFFCEIMNTKL